MPVPEQCEYFVIRCKRIQVELNPLEILSKNGEVVVVHQETDIDWPDNEFHFFKLRLEEGTHPEEVNKEYEQRGLKPIRTHEFRRLLDCYPTLLPDGMLVNQTDTTSFGKNGVVVKRVYHALMSRTAGYPPVECDDLASYGAGTRFFVGRKIR